MSPASLKENVDISNVAKAGNSQLRSSYRLNVRSAKDTSLNIHLKINRKCVSIHRNQGIHSSIEDSRETSDSARLTILRNRRGLDNIDISSLCLDPTERKKKGGKSLSMVPTKQNLLSIDLKTSTTRAYHLLTSSTNQSDRINIRRSVRNAFSEKKQQ